ncbi:LOW QUALITY PROTEIN: deleted in lung and esophageal cancer protein 1-like [Liolophura sinensis]|uniref:LOW QUALITY PROTEIN: deleted in lung and esophageal cancer protein 1-like n=1 Tax=Liolophura sinensis TaxID=3198878 RepID=UPI003158234B
MFHASGEMLTQSSGQEPSMYLERPSSARSQDIRHILTKTFRELFTRDVVDPEKIQSLTVSKDNDDAYHKHYVNALQQIYQERERRMAECAMLERHIMQAQARAMSTDERELNKTAASCDNYFDLGLPTGRPHFRSCLDTDLLRSHGLIVPEDYSTREPSPVRAPKDTGLPSYLEQTLSSSQRTYQRKQEECARLSSCCEGSSPDSSLSEGGDEKLGQDGPAENQLGVPLNKLWQNHLPTEQREVDKRDMANLESKVNFMCNPRHIPPSAPPGGRSLIQHSKKKPKEIGIKSKPEKPVHKEPSVVFLASPPVVTFSQYAVGQVYEMTLELKNVTTVLRPCRVLPPTTPYFSIGLGQFPGEQGLVAPGMSCHYTIRFNPDSLGDYDDVIKVQTQSSRPMLIQLQGRRPPPVLSLPPELDVGFCLVGDLHIAHFLVTNEGGPGRFCLMPTSFWPATNFKSSMKSGIVSLPPFEVRPSVFELQAGQKTIIEVAFHPSQVREYTEEITMVCDNCQVKHFKVKGEAQLAGVKLAAIEGGESSQEPGEICDVTAQHLIKFEELNPFTYTDKTVEIKNQTNVNMHFVWDIYKPLLKTPVLPGADNSDEETATTMRLASGRVSDIDSVFSIHPSSGILPADDTMEFKVTFAPPKVGDFSSVLHMQLKQIPPTPPDVSSLSEVSSVMSTESEAREKTSDSSLLASMPAFEDKTVLEVEVKGKCVPLNVVLHPYAMIIPGTFLVGVTVKKQVVLVNHSYSGIVFHWRSYTEDHILEVEPSFGELGPGMALDLELSITGSHPGKIDQTLLCFVDNLQEPVHLHVEAEFKGPEICIEEPDVNFGLAHLGQSITREITLTNMCQVTTSWRIEEWTKLEEIEDESSVNSTGNHPKWWSSCQNLQCSVEELPPQFTFSPDSGDLKPLASQTLTVTFTPTHAQSLKTMFRVLVADGQDCTLGVCGEVQLPQACLLSSDLHLDEVYLEVPLTREVTLLNQTLMKTQVPVAEGDSRKYLTVEPSEGILQPREELQLTLHFRAHRQAELSDIRVPCLIEGMDNPLCLQVSCQVKGLSVNYSVSLEGQGASEFMEKLKLNFGEETYLGDTPKQYLHIMNESGVTAPFSINMEYFCAKPPTPPNATPACQGQFTGFRQQKGQRRVTLSRTPNLADPFSRTSSKAYQEVCQTMLREGNGAAFLVFPACGEIKPFQEEIIEVTGFSDMWGEYNDNMVVKVGDLEAVLIPVQMNVVGCPLNFQLTAAHPNQQPIIRFGSHIAGTAPVCRKMKINNTSPCDIRLDWEAFYQAPNDKKLVDLVVKCGDPFPPLDPQGNEIVPTLPGTPTMQHYNTDRICDSPDTLPLLSRQTTLMDTHDRVIPSTIEESPSQGQRDKIVTVCLRVHDGIASERPYDVFPKQLTIPAKSSSIVTIRFTPPPTETISMGMDCHGFAHAYLTLSEKDSSKDGRLRRKQGFDLETLRVDMTAHVKPALLTIECTEEEGMRFRGAMSDLMHGGVMSAESLNVCSALLSNQTQTNMTFRLRVKSPFVLVDLDPASTSDGATSSFVTDMCSLKPQHSLLIKVAFKVDIDLLKYLDALETGEEVDGIELDVNSGERKLQFLYDLFIEFNNSAVQNLPLHATLSVPSLILSRDTLDFGTCLVGQRREMDLIISNKTASASHWTVTTETQTDTCIPETFQVVPSSGELEAHVTYVSNSKSLIKVFFTAKHAESYETVFVFQGVLGEEPRRLIVTGQGSYDGKHEAILNI